MFILAKGVIHVEKPPTGLKPRWLVTEQRIQEIKEAINRYYNDHKPVPRDWIEELHELLAWQRAYYQPEIEVEIYYVSNLTLQNDQVA